MQDPKGDDKKKIHPRSPCSLAAAECCGITALIKGPILHTATMAELTLRESGLVNIRTIIGINHMEIVFRDQVGALSLFSQACASSSPGANRTWQRALA